MVRQAPVTCVMAAPIHLGAWSMALMLWLPFELQKHQLPAWTPCEAGMGEMVVMDNQDLEDHLGKTALMERGESMGPLDWLGHLDPVEGERHT